MNLAKLWIGHGSSSLEMTVVCPIEVMETETGLTIVKALRVDQTTQHIPVLPGQRIEVTEVS